MRRLSGACAASRLTRALAARCDSAPRGPATAICAGTSVATGSGMVGICAQPASVSIAASHEWRCKR